ncbi:MAG: hypothetical protein ABI016_12430, partial [Chthoniobacterales bacterium]
MEENDSTRSQLDTVRSWVHLARVATGSGEVVRVDGWVFTETGEPLTEVRAVAAHGTSAAAYPLPRPDVAAAYPAASHSRMSGFALQLPGPPRTRFKLRFEARSPNQDWQVFFKTTVEAADKTGSLLGRLGASRESSVTELPHPAFYLWFDEPLDWTKLPRRFRLSGWCFSRNREPIEAVRVRIGRREFAGSYGIFRADVAQMHSEDVATFKSGFDIIAEAPRGRAIFVLEIRMADGQWQEIFSKKISAPWINLRPIDDSQLWEIGNYGTWIKRYDTLRPADRREIRAHIARLAARPLISIVMPVYNPAAAHLRSAIKSVRAQLYPHW